jgi:hypothetical protein
MFIKRCGLRGSSLSDVTTVDTPAGKGRGQNDSNQSQN